MKKNKCIVFDRDGTLLNFVNYLLKPDDVKLVDGARETLKLLMNKSHKIFLHTNQSGVSRGYFKIQDVENCNNRMIELLGLGNFFESICIATDYPPGKDSYRKPSPKFGLEIIQKYEINKSNLIYVGDNISDMETAKNIGCMAFGVNYGVYDLRQKMSEREDVNYPIYDDLYSVGLAILNYE